MTIAWIAVTVAGYLVAGLVIVWALTADRKQPRGQMVNFTTKRPKR